MTSKRQTELARVREQTKRQETLRREGTGEANRRQEVTRLLRDEFPRLHAELEPPSAAIEADENNLTLRYQRGDTVRSALWRELSYVQGHWPAEAMVEPHALVERLASAYDPDTALPLERLPENWVTAERVYAHVLSFEVLRSGMSHSVLAAVARRLTVILLTRKWLQESVDDGTQGNGQGVDDGMQETRIPENEDDGMQGTARSHDGGGKTEAQANSLCLDCGSELPSEGARCATCEGEAKGDGKQETNRLPNDGKQETAREEAPRAESPQRHLDPLARRVVGYARLRNDLTFAKDRGRGRETLERGVVVEVIAPSERDQHEIELKKKQGKQLVTIRWKGQARLVYGYDLERAQEADFKPSAGETGELFGEAGGPT